jgi:poly-beta-1,6-N-acetyl-D-glucosamine synthase
MCHGLTRQTRQSGSPAAAEEAEARRPRVLVLVPAYNEAGSLARTVDHLQAQTRPPDGIILLPNNCTDDTERVASALAVGEVASWPYPGRNVDKKAGALNRAIDLLLPELSDGDLVLVTDADSILSPVWIETAIAVLSAEPRSGAVCASFYAEHKKGLLPLLQRNEYSRFARMTSRKRGRAQVLSGVATILPVRLIRRILAARAAGELPASAGVYHTACATEDIELTFAVRALGYRPVAPDRCWAITDALESSRALVSQRDRWQRGMLDSLRLYGVRRWTVPYLARTAGIYLGSLLVPAYLALLAATALMTGSVPFDWRWSTIGLLFATERAWTVRGNGVPAVLTALLVVPEWAYEQIRSYAYWTALWKTLRGAERDWVAT